MKKKNILTFVFDGFADWETAYAMVGITRSDSYRVPHSRRRENAGNLHGRPDRFPPTSTFVLLMRMTLIPRTPRRHSSGGSAWEDDRNTEITELLRHCVAVGIPVAAICGATLSLARLGAFATCQHTSNDETYLEAFAPDYSGRDNYRHQPAITSNGIVTAAGTAAVEFAQEIFELLEIADNQEVKEWFGYIQSKMVQVANDFEVEIVFRDNKLNAMKRNATANWKGSGKEGKGTLTSQSSVLNSTQYSFNSRFADGVGTNPEELIAAAHAGCFTMKLSFSIGEAGFTPEDITTTCTITLDNGAITESHLAVKAKIPGISKEKFDAATADAKANRPISKLLNTNITLETVLV